MLASVIRWIKIFIYNEYKLVQLFMLMGLTKWTDVFSFLFVRRSREGKALEESDKVKIVSSADGMYTLKLLNLTEEDSGQYTIKAVNDAGQTACTATLLVHGQSI